MAEASRNHPHNSSVAVASSSVHDHTHWVRTHLHNHVEEARPHTDQLPDRSRLALVGRALGDHPGVVHVGVGSGSRYGETHSILRVEESGDGKDHDEGCNPVPGVDRLSRRHNSPWGVGSHRVRGRVVESASDSGRCGLESLLGSAGVSGANGIERKERSTLDSQRTLLPLNS